MGAATGGMATGGAATGTLGMIAAGAPPKASQSFPRMLPRAVPPQAERRRSAMPAILALSLATHVAAIGAAALLATPMQPKPEGEVAVEVVSEMPREKAPETKRADAGKGDAESAEAKAAEAKAAEAARQEQAKAEPVKPEPPKPTAAEQAQAERDQAEQAQAEQAKAAQAEQARAAQAEQAKAAQAEQAQAEQAQAEQAKSEQAKAEQAKAEQAQAEQAKAQAETQAMRDELARLQAEQQALKAEAPQAAPDPAQAPLRGGMRLAGQAAGTGPLASSFQAIALPQESEDGEGDLVGYQAIVFSRLAKAKAVGRQLGIPGSAGVAFAVDEHGALLSVRLAVSSGIAKLDEEALAIVRKAAPFPAPPEGASRTFEANVNFVVGAGG